MKPDHDSCVLKARSFISLFNKVFSPGEGEERERAKERDSAKKRDLG